MRLMQPDQTPRLDTHDLDVLPNGFLPQQIALALSPRHQELILLPTEKCNFRCTYCYEDFELGRMSEKTQRALELFIDRRTRDLDTLKLSWFGGEPLLAKSVVLRLSRFAKKLCDERGVTLSGGLTTNGYALDQALARELISLNQNFFQITLDGWKAGHDSHRKRADGGGTFDRIWGNLRALRDLNDNFEVCVRVHVRKDNQENLEVLMQQYALEFYGDNRFRLDFQHLRDLGGAGGESVNGVTLDELMPIEIRLRRAVIAEVKRLKDRAALERSHLIPHDDRPDDFIVAKAANAGESAGSQRRGEQFANAPYICYAAKANSLLVRSNGRLGKCTVAFDDDRNDIGYLADDGRVIVNQEKYRPWMQGMETLDVEAVGCPIRFVPHPYKKHAKLSSIAVAVVA